MMDTFIYKNVLLFMACIYVAMLIIRYTNTRSKAESVTVRNKNELKLGKNLMCATNMQKCSVHKKVLKYMIELSIERNLI